MTFEMLKTGKIINTSGADALVNSMANVSGITDPVQLEAFKAGMEKEYGGDKIAAGFEQFTYIYPDTRKKTKIGSSWKNELEGDLTAQNTWTLDAVDTRGLVISGKSDVQIKIDSNGTVISVTGDQKVALTANPGHGFITSFHSEGEATGMSKVAALPGEEIPTTIITITDYTIK